MLDFLKTEIELLNSEHNQRKTCWTDPETGRTYDSRKPEKIRVLAVIAQPTYGRPGPMSVALPVLVIAPEET
jgi:hypothetical protein